MFEIELRDNYEDLFQYRDEEIDLIHKIKFESKPRKCATPPRKGSSYFFSNLQSHRSAATPGRFRGDESQNDKGRVRAKSEYERQVKQLEKSKYELAISHVEKSTFISANSPCKTTRVIQGHLMPIRDLDEGNMRWGYLEDQGKF
jgi:hypothetical protein